MYQNWPDQIVPTVNFVPSPDGPFGLGSGSGSGSPGPSPGKAVSGSAALRVTQTARRLPLGGRAQRVWGPGCAVGRCRCGCGVRWHRVLGCGSGVASSVCGGGGGVLARPTSLG